MAERLICNRNPTRFEFNLRRSGVQSPTPPTLLFRFFPPVLVFSLYFFGILFDRLAFLHVLSMLRRTSALCLLLGCHSASLALWPC